MPSPEEIKILVEKLKSNTLMKSSGVSSGFRILLAVFFMGIGYFIGQVQINLMLHGFKTQGAVIGHKWETTSVLVNGTLRPYGGGYHPVVEIQVEGRQIKFTDWRGYPSAGTITGQVLVLYNPKDPQEAMITGSLTDWIPWAPMMGVGLFLILVSTKKG